MQSRAPQKPRPHVLVCALACGFGAAVTGPAWAQQEALPPLQLKPSTRLQENLPPSVKSVLPTYLSGERTSGRANLESVLEGHAELRRGDTVIQADRLEYYQPDDQARASGKVRINRAGSVYEGPLLELKLDASEGFFLQPSYRLLGGGHGRAERIDFIDEHRSVVTRGTYTTCRREGGPSWMPDWILRAASIKIDTEEDVGVATDATLSFKGVPILPVPYLTFPLSGERKSGFLPPTVGADSTNGAELTVPYYWNIAPNRDAKFTPSLLTKRGVDLGAEFRFLEADYRGEVRGSVLPGDLLRGTDRWSLGGTYSGQHSFGPVRNVALSMNISRVSDDSYWKDFARESTGLTQRLLANDATVAWSHGSIGLSVRALKWQTLQDPTSPITPPYDRLPQVVARYAPPPLRGWSYSLEADHTQFQSDPSYTGQPNGKRTYVLGQVSHTWRMPGYYVTPKLQWHGAQYEFDSALANGARSFNRAVPTFSLDAGMVFERQARFLGRDVLQTLEPRAFYVRTPFVDQGLLPLYDTGAHDFNFSSVFKENAYVGNDRIADNNLLTLGLTSRLLDNGSGAELVRFGVAQRLRFEDQQVTLPGVAPVTDRLSDVLLGATINWTPRWTFDTTYQYNPKTEESTRATWGARFSPGDYRVINAAYRYQRGLSEQVDVGWQWPLNDLWGDHGQALGPGQGQGSGRWYSVGRLNFSVLDKKLVDAVVGFEYDAGCWLGRIVLEQLQISTGAANQRIMFQLEFVGFARLGANPLKSLRDNIPRYQLLREQTTLPSRFTQYD